MNKQEITIVVSLFLLLFAWGALQRKLFPPPPPGEQTVEQIDELAAPDGATPPLVAAGATGAPPAAVTETVPAVPSIGTPSVATPTNETPAAPEERVVLANDVTMVTVSSWGAAIVSVELAEFRANLEKDSPPIVLDFGDGPALAIGNVVGLTRGSSFEVTSQDGSNAVLEARAPNGLTLQRALSLGETYSLTVTDTFRNTGTTPVALPAHSMGLGPMTAVQTKAKVRGISYLGLDLLPLHGGEGVQHKGRKLSALFGYTSSPLSCARPNAAIMPPRASSDLGIPLAWVAAKNKFFVQILEPEEGSADGRLNAARDPAASNTFAIATVSAALFFPEQILQPGESLTRNSRYYAGPKKYTELRRLGHHFSEAMEFGFFKPICKVLLPLLNAIHTVVPNYGLAIILLTIIVKVIFWPVTHKSTESMKRMQEIQPHVTEIRERLKGNPQKMNQEIMALYKEHKVNPMAGCLPMLIQIPVFIGLFTVLRSAVELRFAPFLWIRDLSEPESLLAGAVPIIGSINLLPLFMTATMAWQQTLTPSATDPQQKRMMMMMPVVMLFIFYNMPSALVLYWSTSQMLSIAQLLMQKRKRAQAEA